jgi:hypothetical protein
LKEHHQLQFSPSRLLVAERRFMKQSGRIALCLAPLLLGFFVLAFGASRLRSNARTPFCFADAATAQDAMHSAIVVVSPSPITRCPNREVQPVFPRYLATQAMLDGTVLPSPLRAPPVFRI